MLFLIYYTVSLTVFHSCKPNSPRSSDVNSIFQTNNENSSGKKSNDFIDSLLSIDTLDIAIPQPDSQRNSDTNGGEKKEFNPLSKHSKKESSGSGIPQTHQAQNKKGMPVSDSPQDKLKNNATDSGNQHGKGSTETTLPTAEKTSAPDRPMYPHTPKPPTNSEQFNLFFISASNFLQRYVNNGLVNYRKIKNDKTELNALVRKISFTDLSDKTDTEQQAFYINAYNILVIKSVVDHNIPSSAHEVSGFFDEFRHQVAHKSLTLNQLEKKELFGLKKDPRIHFALVRGDRGGPLLPGFAFTPQQLNAQLTQQTRDMVNDYRFVKVNTTSKTATLSEIFREFQDSFTTNSKTITGFINQYRNAPIPDGFRIEYVNYDRSLNHQ